ncbi:MAG TPA: putative Ig domain-containing protein, partial [Verrucomicrobiota bacterium]|nr:putative Ig domain-containing protein [Verrucomicrobiota bacterium]
NNKLTSADAISVGVSRLTLNQPFTDTLGGGQERLYAVTVGAGETLEISLDSSSDDCATALYARRDGLPDSIRYDAAYEGRLQADQSILVPTTTAGTYYILVRVTSGPSTNTVTLTARTLPFQITSVMPDFGGDDRYVAVTVRGARFDPNAIIKLVRPQFGEFEPVNYKVVDATKIVAWFDLRGAPHGLYDVTVINPGGQSVTVPYRYLVETALPLDLTVGMGGKGQLEIGETGWYGLGIYSLTNVAAPYVHLEIGVPRVPNPAPNLIPGEALVFRTNLYGQPKLDGVPWAKLEPVVNLKGELTATGFSYDFVNQGYIALTANVETYPELKRLLKEDPDFLKGLADFEVGMLAFQFHIYAAATPMTAAEYVRYQMQRAEQFRAKILADPAAPPALIIAAADSTAWTYGWLAALTDTGLLRPEDEPPAIRLTPEFASLMAAVSAAMLGMPAGSEVIAGGELAAFFEQVRAWYGHDDTAYGSATIPDAAQFDLKLTHPTHFEAFTVQVGQMMSEGGVVRPQDPNILDYLRQVGGRSDLVSISGPSGFGSQNMVPGGTPLPFIINFENPANARQAVNTLRLYVQMDPNLDVRTFKLGDLFLGDIQVHLPGDLGAFTGEFDFIEERGFLLRVTAGMDVVTRTAMWVITAIDPDTGLPTTREDLGVLAKGARGSAGYSIEAHWEAPTAVQLRTTVRAFYNEDAPFVSSPVTQTLDNAAPTSSVQVRDLGNGSYELAWSGQDEPGGSGLKDYTVYVSSDGVIYSAFLRRTTQTTATYTGFAGEKMQFLVLACDNAGNVQQAPEGLTLPPYNPNVQLGSLPQAPAPAVTVLTEPLPPTQPASNALFLRAVAAVPATLADSRRPAFSAVYEPFVASAFAWGFADSGAGISPLGIAFSPDGASVYVSGGRGRNSLYKFSMSAGGRAVTPLTTLDVPIYDMLFDRDGLLWATTGGGPLVQIDPNTGSILERYGEGVTLGIAPSSVAGKLYVATRNGVELFDTQTGTFSLFSATRVHALALAPDGTLWGTTWPDGGQVVAFDRKGRPEVKIALSQRAEGLAFGQPGTLLAGLLFVSHANGVLTMVDMASGRTTPLATGGTRGDFLHVSPDGRLFVTQSKQVDVFQPLLPPHIVATTPVDRSLVSGSVSAATVVFDIDMDPASVTALDRYLLRNVGNNIALEIGGAVYDATARTVHLQFEPLPADTYELVVGSGVRSAGGLTLGQPYTAGFSVLDGVTETLVPQFANTRIDRLAGTVTFEVSVTNTSQVILASPVRVVFDGLPVDGVAALSPDGMDESGHPYFDLGADTGSQLAPGQTTVSRTVTIANPLAKALDLRPRVLAARLPNRWPMFTPAPAPGDRATVGQSYSATFAASDPDGGTVTYRLLRGPAGATIDPATGALRWTPSPADAAAVPFEVRAYDTSGGYARHQWSVAVSGVNTPPVIAPIPDQTLAEGDRLELRLGAFDADGDTLRYWMDNLPPGAVFDSARQTLVWQTDGYSAGRYPDVTLYAADRYSQVSQSFTVVVSNRNQAPVLAPIVSHVLAEGQTIKVQLAASDSDGDAVRFFSRNLPLGATLDPVNGLFLWTPGYDQHGEYSIEFGVTDGEATDIRTAGFTVTNVNGPVRFGALERLVLYEGQDLAIRLIVYDPDHPALPVSQLLSDQEWQIEVQDSGARLTFSHEVLPTGAAFDPATQLLTWTPGYTQAGIYNLSFAVTDDGDGTGVPTSA